MSEILNLLYVHCLVIVVVLPFSQLLILAPIPASSFDDADVPFGSLLELELLELDAPEGLRVIPNGDGLGEVITLLDVAAEDDAAPASLIDAGLGMSLLTTDGEGGTNDAPSKLSEPIDPLWLLTDLSLTPNGDFGTSVAAAAAVTVSLRVLVGGLSEEGTVAATAVVDDGASVEALDPLLVADRNLAPNADSPD